MKKTTGKKTRLSFQRYRRRSRKEKMRNLKWDPRLG